MADKLTRYDHSVIQLARPGIDMLIFSIAIVNNDKVELGLCSIILSRSQTDHTRYDTVQAQGISHY